MGIVFGMTGTAEPSYQLLKTIGTYELRYYQPYFIAEVPMTSNDGQAFNVLAKYIGVFGTPANEKSAPMAMTSPVITQPVKIKMTSPVITSASSSSESMKFVLPFEFKDIKDVPKPTDKRVTIKHIPTRILASYRYSGAFDANVANDHASNMIEVLKKEKLMKDNADPINSQWEVAQYHPPFTIAHFRRNEVWVILDANNEIIKELMKK